METLNIHNGLPEKLLSEWHPTKNHGINPDELTNESWVSLPIPRKRGIRQKLPINRQST
ncbi:hypothetical protein ACQGS6_16335 [Bacillus sp. GMs2/2]|uniref:hypothetical protein n=1 Tax=Bacillus sp. GMs2/2 TaxID=3418494 RepID=UPI003CFAA321